MKEFVIIDVETNYTPQDGEIIIVRANPVTKPIGFEHIENITGKKYVQYTSHVCSETEYFMIKHSETKCQEIINIAPKYKEGIFWTPDLSSFYDSQLGLPDGQIISIHKDNSLRMNFHKKVECKQLHPINNKDVKHVNVFNTKVIRIFAKTANLYKVDNETTYVLEGEKVHFIVPDDLKYNKIIDDALNNQDRLWEMDITPFQNTRIMIPGRWFFNEGYIHNSIPSWIIDENLDQIMGQ